MRVGDRLAQLLGEYGVDYVFGVPGGQTLPLYAGIMRSGGRVSHVLMRDERSAGFAADAWARFSGRTGVCDATVGPGATNLLSPLGEAYSSSVPIVAIVSDIARGWDYRRVRGNASQGMRQIEMFQTVSKWQTTLTDPAAVDNVIDTAFRVATTGRPGPVVVAVPEDVAYSALADSALKVRPRSATVPVHRPAPDPEALQLAVRAILRAERPVLLVGGGAMASGAFAQVQALAAHLDAPVTTTMSGKGIVAETDPRAFGVAGSMGNPIANQILKASDLVIFIGSKAGQIATYGYDVPSPGAGSIHIDVDPEEIGRNFADSVPLVADARTAVTALLAALGAGRPKTTWDLADLGRQLAAWYRDEMQSVGRAAKPLHPPSIMKVVNEEASEDDVVVADASLASGWMSVFYRARRATRQYFAPRGLAGLGWGAPAAVGAALAAGGGRRVLLFAGDGGFAYSVQELEVMVRLKLPVVTIIFNNDTLGWIKHTEKKRIPDGIISADFSHVDFAMVARGFGARGYSVRTLAELQSALQSERIPSGPALIDVASDQWATPVLRSSSIGE